MRKVRNKRERNKYERNTAKKRERKQEHENYVKNKKGKIKQTIFFLNLRKFKK